MTARWAGALWLAVSTAALLAFADVQFSVRAFDRVVGVGRPAPAQFPSDLLAPMAPQPRCWYVILFEPAGPDEWYTPRTTFSVGPDCRESAQ